MLILDCQEGPTTVLSLFISDSQVQGAIRICIYNMTHAIPALHLVLLRLYLFLQ